MRPHRAFLISLILCLPSATSASEPLVVHEWGTFTSFQTEFGEGLRRINTDDEPVPPFVHRLGRVNLVPPTAHFSPPEVIRTQGAPTADPRVTMRLETPVLYFHLPPGQKAMTVDVTVDFRNGFLTEFFPWAYATVDGKPVADYRFPETARPLGSLRWSEVQVGQSAPMPETTEHVWLAPRQVKAAPVVVRQESERFLFYRGVGDVPSPLRVIRHPDQILDIRVNESAQRQLDEASQTASNTRLRLSDRTHWNQIFERRQLWLLDVRRDGAVAFRRLPESTRRGQYADQLFMTSGVFADREFSTERLDALRGQMHEALVSDGLFEDEAEALLNTWQLSYFQSPGQRLLYLVPRVWTDAVLPLKLSVRADITRVMVGRIELVTPRQRELIRQIAESPVPDLTEVLQKMAALQRDPARRADYNALASGRGDSSILGVPVPPIYEAFLNLGRFRSSLLLDVLERANQSEAPHLDRIRHLNFELIHPGKLSRE